MATARRSAASDAGVPRDAGGRARRGRQHAAGLSPRPGGLSAPSSSAKARRSRPPQPADIGAYMRAMSEAGLAPASRARRLSAIRQLFKFLVGEGVIAEDPAQGLAGPKKGRALPKTLSVAEVDRLIEAARRAHRSAPRAATACARCACMPDRDAVRHGHARQRAGDAAAHGAGRRRPRADDQGQGRPRAPRAAERRRRARRSTAISTSAGRRTTTSRR